MLAAIKKHFTILLLTVGHGLVDTYIGLLQVVAPGLAFYLGLPLGDIVVLIGFSSLFCNLVQPVAGHFMGKFNMSWVLPAGVLLSILPSFMGFAVGYWSLAALVVLGAIGTGIYHPEGVLSAHDATGDKFHIGVPLFFSGGAGIYALGTPLSLRISESLGFPALSLLAVPGLAVTALFLLQHRRLRLAKSSVVMKPRSKRLTSVVEGNISYWPLLATALFLCIGFGLFMALLSSHFELTFGPDSRIWSGYVLMVMGFLGSVNAFFWSSLARKHGFYTICLLTQLCAAPLYVYMAFPASPAMGFLVAIPLSLINPYSIYPTAVTLSRNAAGLTQSMRTSLIMGGTSGLSSLVVMGGGIMLRRGMPSEYLMLGVAGCCFVAALLAAWQLLARRKARTP